MIFQGLVFALWAFLSFRTLFQIRAIAAARTGAMFPGPVSFLRAFGVWLKDPANRGAAWLWLLSFAAMFATSAVIAFSGGI